MDNHALPALVQPGDLVGLAGGPFSDASVRSASEQIRALCGWHVAPVISETLTLDSHGGKVVWLPTRRVVNVTAVRDVSGDSPRELSGWRWSQDGLLSVPGSLPCGFRVLEVDLEHGYDACPADLLPVVAGRTSRRVMQESLGSRSVTYGADGDRTIDQSLALYRLGPRS